MPVLARGRSSLGNMRMGAWRFFELTPPVNYAIAGRRISMEIGRNGPYWEARFFERLPLRMMPIVLWKYSRLTGQRRSSSTSASKPKPGGVVRLGKPGRQLPSARQRRAQSGWPARNLYAARGHKYRRAYLAKSSWRRLGGLVC